MLMLMLKQRIARVNRMKLAGMILASHMNEWKRLLAEIKIIKLNKKNNNISNIKQHIYQRCFQITRNIYGNPKSLVLNLFNLAYRYKPTETISLDFSKFL